MGLADSRSETSLDKLWDEFLGQWPLDKLKDLTLEQYTQVGTKGSFTYWLESGTDGIGSVWGGSSFKFGIFNRKARKGNVDGAGRRYSDDYAWYAKYGNDPNEAFGAVKKVIEKVAKAARNGELESIDKADLGTSIKWKLAFMYQDRVKS
jgi:5-methylcytosine-specific restriction enzyme B